MKKGKKIIILGFIIYIVFAIFATILYYNNNNNSYIEYESKYVLSMVKKSEILQEKIGVIKIVKLNKNKRHSYKKIGYWAYYEEFTIVNENNEKYNVKIIFNDELTEGIYAYILDGEIIYENIEKVQPNVNELGEVIIWKRL